MSRLRLVSALALCAALPLTACTPEDDGGSSGSAPGNPRGDAGRDLADASAEPPLGCGDGEVAGDEDCDGNASVDVTCGDLGLGNGLVRCGADCRYDFSGCSTCGNGRLDGAEECDTEGIAGDCTLLGFGEGSLFCRSDCQFDTRQCGDCGNGQLDGDESCDGTAFRESCASRGLGGTPVCTADCETNFATCNNLCGNGRIDAEVEEACDGADVGGRTCASLGYDVPVAPVCTASCTLDVSPCTDYQECGNERQEGTEECDGDDVPTSCQDLGYEWGFTRCGFLCRLDSSDCDDAAPFCNIIDHVTGINGSASGSLGPGTFSRSYPLWGETHYYEVTEIVLGEGDRVRVEVTSDDFGPYLLILDSACVLLAEDADGTYVYGPAPGLIYLKVLVTSNAANGAGDWDLISRYQP